MDSIFKQKLLNLRNPPPPKTFGQALFKEAFVAKEEFKKPVLNPSQVETFTEKKQVIESLERFAQEKSEELESPIIKIEGGEIHLRSHDAAWDGIKVYDSVFKLRENLKLDAKFLDVVLQNKTQSEVRVIFVSEKFRQWSDLYSELKEGFINELIVGFPVKTAELFERMIMAMKLEASEVIIYPVEGSDETDFSKDLMEVATFYKPEVIITLGAKATNKILKLNDRLSMIHGQFYTRKVLEDLSFQVVPLFHPSIIETNQNMKKTAWTDMQKIMKFLKKLP